MLPFLNDLPNSQPNFILAGKVGEKAVERLIVLLYYHEDLR